MSVAQDFRMIVALVQSKEFYVPRDYRTMGGMWTRDTWSRSGVSVFVEDEGYTTRISAEGLHVIRGADNSYQFLRGDAELLGHVLGELLRNG